MTPEQLKASILQMAIQGKLVEQRPEEGTAEELYQKIQKEKQKLIKEGKIKKEKPLEEIREDEIPFDIPESWKWVRLGKIMLSITAGGDKPNDFIEVKDKQHPIPVVANGVTNDGIIGYTSEVRAKAGTITVAGRGTIGFSVYRKYDYCPVVRLIVIEIPQVVCPEYIQYVIQALPEKSVGTSIPQLTVPMLFPKLIPLPPIDEQHRIVSKIEELLPYVDHYAASYEKLEQFNAKFPEDMKKSILQYAIQGKLVEQRPEEGTGEQLYQKIQKEKQKLIKEGKIKKEKPLEEIKEDEIPFDIPESWKWVRLSDVVDVRDGTHDSPGYIPKGYPLITGKDFYNGYFELSKTKYISDKDYTEIVKRSKVEVGDILFSMIGGNIGSMIMITEENYFDMAIKNVALFKQYDYSLGMSDYLLLFLKSQVTNMQAVAKGGAQSFVSLSLLRNYIIPLPPINEQKRIVKKVNEMMVYCERLQ